MTDHSEFDKLRYEIAKTNLDEELRSRDIDPKQFRKRNQQDYIDLIKRIANNPIVCSAAEKVLDERMALDDYVPEL